MGWFRKSACTGRETDEKMKISGLSNQNERLVLKKGKCRLQRFRHVKMVDNSIPITITNTDNISIGHKKPHDKSRRQMSKKTYEDRRTTIIQQPAKCAKD